MKKLVALLLLSLVLFACGDSSTTESASESAFTDDSSVKDTVIVEADTLYLADNYSCTTKELKDKSGLKVVCNGDSIGVVLNGKNGKNGANGKEGARGEDGEKGDDGVAGNDGEDGLDGISCSITNKTDSSVTITCGDSSITLKIDNDIGSIADTAEIDSERIAISLDSLTGFSQKGPFLKGGTVYLYELSDGRTLKQTNGNFTSEITSDDGRYSFSSRNLLSQYALIVVDGKYRNEVTGEPTATTIKLQASTNMLSRRSANVNLLTHLESLRVYYLVTRKKMRLREAKKKAQYEIFGAFHIDPTEFAMESEDLDVFGKTDADAALLAISVLLQGSGNETDLSVLLVDVMMDLEDDGLWTDSLSRAKIADWAIAADSASDSTNGLMRIRKNVENWQLSSAGVPDFEKVVRRFYSLELGLGVCGDDVLPETVKEVPNVNSIEFYAEDYLDTTRTKVRYICDLKTQLWRPATDIEKDRFKWNPRNAKDGSLLDAPITGKKMVWDADTLRYADSTEISWDRGCVSYIRGESFVFANQLSHYKCSAEGWIFDIEGSSGTMRDAAGTRYRTITIGNQTWMAENLNYKTEESDCDRCEETGRFYTWKAADKACPRGWHLPTKGDWETLFITVGGDSTAALVLKSTSGWKNNGNGVDAFGFSAQPVGLGQRVGDLFGEGTYAYFWSSTHEESSNAYVVYFDYFDKNSHMYTYNDVLLHSVRCIEDF